MSFKVVCRQFALIPRNGRMYKYYVRVTPAQHTLMQRNDRYAKYVLVESAKIAAQRFRLRANECQLALWDFTLESTSIGRREEVVDMVPLFLQLLRIAKAT